MENNAAQKTDAEPVEPVADGGAEDNASYEAEQELLDEEATELLAELAKSQQEVQQLIRQQQEQSHELGGMRDRIASELEGLQEDSWRLQVYAELEALKDQLQVLSSLQAAVDDVEAGAEPETEESSSLQAPATDPSDPAQVDDIEGLQDRLDEELEQLFAQLQTVKREAQLVAAKKASLEVELAALLRQQQEMEEEEAQLAIEEANSGLTKVEDQGT